MLADFQQALADLVAAPDHCQAIRDGDLDELDGYDLTMTERGRLVAIALHRGMAANCAIYRSNRLTPIVINLPDTCAALGPRLRPVIDRFWATHPTEHFVHRRDQIGFGVADLRCGQRMSPTTVTSSAPHAPTNVASRHVCCVMA